MTRTNKPSLVRFRASTLSMLALSLMNFSMIGCQLNDVQESTNQSEQAAADRSLTPAPLGVVAAVRFSLAGGTYIDPLLVTLSTTSSGAKVYYTTDGTSPTVNSILYTNAGIIVNTSTKISAIAVLSGWTNSPVSSATYTISGRLAMPTLSPGPGVYRTAPTVAITGPTGATIYYTLNGSTPTANSIPYLGPVKIPGSATIRAIAVKKGANNSFERTGDYDVLNGTFTDTRDNQSYRYLTIGSQRWMAQNLNYSAVGSCYANSLDTCKKYGRLYTWNQAMNNSASSPTGAKGICPTYWHVPSTSDWITLMQSVGGGTNVGTYLKSASNDWLSYSGVFNLDTFGFSAKPGGGYISAQSKYMNVNKYGYWWTSVESSSTTANHIILAYNTSNATMNFTPKADLNSLRCIHD